MNIVVFGLTISSSWGNGHATQWRGLIKALAERGCRTTFFERDQPYYATHRDFGGTSDVKVVLYSDWSEVRAAAAASVRDADVVIVSSYCPDGAEAAELQGPAYQVRVLYDLDTPVTLDLLERGEVPSFLGPAMFEPFDLVLSFTGGPVLDRLTAYGARRVGALYGFVDPALHRRVRPRSRFRADLSFLGTYAEDRQQALDELFITTARRQGDRRFLIGGAQYPADFAWQPNIFFVHHLAPGEHAAFFSSSRLTLNVTRGIMKRFGWCPSGRLFEAAACGTPIISDRFDGIDAFFKPGEELLLADSAADVEAALQLSGTDLGQIADAALARVLSEHTAGNRAEELITAVEACRLPSEPFTPDVHALGVAQE